jgi:hypothetical protein
MMLSKNLFKTHIWYNLVSADQYALSGKELSQLSNIYAKHCDEFWGIAPKALRLYVISAVGKLAHMVLFQFFRDRHVCKMSSTRNINNSINGHLCGLELVSTITPPLHIHMLHL